MQVRFPVTLIPQLAHVQPDDFRAMGIDGYCSYWHYKPLAEHVCALVKPKNIFEIGFFLGSSAYCWLSSSDANVVSCDPIIDAANCRDRVFSNAANLSNHFGGRLTFIDKFSERVLPDIKHISFDLAFIDGRHDLEGATHDIMLCGYLKIPYILLDDFNGPVIQAYQQFLNVYKPIQGYALENPPITNQIDCLLCKLEGTP